VFGYHGDDDPQIKLAWAQRGVDELKARGETVYFKSYPGVGHALSTEELAEILGILDRATAREAKRR
jgi:predicted esterase